MKNLIRTKRYIAALFSILLMGVFGSCTNSDDSGVKTYEYREQIGKKMKEITALQGESEFGLRKGMYPEESRQILETAINELKGLLQTIKEEGIATQQIPDETAKALKKADERIIEFKATIRTEDLNVPAALQVNGKNGGYIDFGAHPEYATFGSLGQQAFTVEFWVKLKDVEGFFFLLSTFVDDESNNHERKGWCVNSYNYGANNMRMTYGMGFNDLMEPAFGFNTINEWVHLAIVTDETGVDGEIRDGRPVMTKMYLNGELQMSTVSHQDASKPYAPNGGNVPMVGFTGMSASGSPLADKGANGSMKHMHIWKVAKTQAEIQQIMTAPENVTGEEPELVCGWAFTRLALDDQNIPDLTGRYSAKLVGDYKWLELE